jgi:Zn/Cd-binding protein ZinT
MADDNKLKKKDLVAEEALAEVQAIDSAAIKEYERKNKAKALADAQVVAEVLVDFDQWWSVRFPVLGQPSHLKDVLRADFKARKLNKLESLERWDWAARVFGLKF